MESLFVFIFGLSIGSFLNVLIDRWSSGESIGGRSYCDFCKKQLSALHLFPVISFLFLKGRSGCCNKKLSLYYPFVELLTGVVSVLIYQWTGPTIDFLFFAAAAACCIVILFADVKYHIIPDQATFGLGFFGFLINVFIYENQFWYMYILAGLVYMSLFFGLFTVTKGKGLGFGDVKLAFVIGLILGFKAGFIAIYLAFLIGGLVSILLVVLYKKNLKTAIPFGPFLLLGILLTFIFKIELFILFDRFLPL